MTALVPEAAYNAADTYLANKSDNHDSLGAVDAAAPHIAAAEARNMADYFADWADGSQWNTDERNMLKTVVTALQARSVKLVGEDL